MHEQAAPPRPQPLPPAEAPQPHHQPPTIRSVPNGSSTGEGARPAATTSSSRNIATSRKVSRLLDITINSALRDLVEYVDEAVPTFFDPSIAESAGAVAGAAAGKPTGQPGGAALVTSTSPSVSTSAAGLRSALEGRVIDMHRDFLRRFQVLHDSFREVSEHVHDLSKECAAMERALGMSRDAPTSSTVRGSGGVSESQAARVDGSSGGARMGDGKTEEGSLQPRSALNSFAETEVLVRRVTGLQRELQSAQRRQQDIKAFKERYNFGAAEQKVLEEGQVDTHYLDVLEQARAVHRQSRSLLLSREHQQSAGAVIESTYNAIMRATEKISRFLLALSASSGSGGGGGDPRGGVGSSGHMRDGAGMISSLAADVPEVSSLFLRCAAVLKAENVSQWEQVMEELSRVRRASVLRRYFHLLTTGSATTSAGTYRAGVSTAGGEGGRSNDPSRVTATAQRPLEAELNNPVFFFSSLFAWLHQCIVEEDDFLNLLFSSDGSAVDPSGGGSTSEGSGDLLSSVSTRQQTTLSKRALLGFIMDGVTKHVRTAFDSVLERFVKASAVLGHIISTSPSSGGEASGGAAASVLPAASGDAAHKLGLTPAQTRAPRGLTGGLTRLLFAATGRHIASPNSGGGGTAGFGGILQRYSNVSSREQQETVMASLMRGPLYGLHICYQLLQLFAYYGAATFLPMLGHKTSLTTLVVESANVELQRVLQQLVKFISMHLFDSVAGVVSRLQVLRRLSSAYEASLEAYKGQAAVGDSKRHDPSASPASATNAEEQGKAPSQSPGRESDEHLPPKRFVLDFLFKHYSLLTDGTDDSAMSRSDLSVSAFGSSSGAGGSTDPQQQASAIELARSLQQLILPATPEVAAMLKLLQQLLRDTARQQQMLTAMKEQRLQQQHRQQQETKGSAEGADTDAEAAAGMEEGESMMYCMTVVQSLLSFPVLLSSQAVASHGLDDPCKCVLELNCFYALRAVLEQSQPLLLQPVPLQATAPASTSAASAHHADEAEATAGAASGVGVLVSIVDSETARLEDALVQHLAAAAGLYYFKNAHIPSELKATTADSSGSGVGRQHAAIQQAIRSALYWLYNFYNLIASNGTLPTLPLVPSLASTAAQSRVHKRVTHLVVADYGRVYGEVKTELQAEAQEAFLNAEEASTFADMKPEKLAVLLNA